VSDAKFKIDNRDKNLSSHWQIGNVIRHGSPCFHSHVSIYTMYLPLKKKKEEEKKKGILFYYFHFFHRFFVIHLSV